VPKVIMKKNSRKFVALLCSTTMALQSATIIMAADEDSNISKESLTIEDDSISEENSNVEDSDISEESSANEELETLSVENDVVSSAAVLAEVSMENKIIPLSAETESDANKEYAQWQFQKGEGASIETVSIPHCWNKEDGIDGGSDYWQGKATYTKTVDVSEINNKSAFLQFDGVNKITDVYIDGEHVGKHIGGYTAFAFDISEYIKGKDSIEIRAEVDNKSSTYNPTTGDFTQYGGIYRDVRIFTTNDIYISKEDYGSSGVYTRPIVVDGTISDGGESGKIADATLEVKTKISFKNTNEQTVNVVSTLKDKNGAIVSTQTSDVTGAVNGGNVQIEDVELDFGTIENVHLWNGIQKGQNKAYLYTLDIEVQDEDGNILDSQSQKIGFRKFDFKAVGTQEAEQSGFWLNDTPYLLRGVAVHQDFEGYGNAVYNDVRMKDFDLMKEMGVNTIRAAHYPYDQFYYDTADEMGFVVWAENPNVNQVSTVQEYKDNGIEQLKEMVYQLYNHASIACWAIENQVGSSSNMLDVNSKPDPNTMNYLHLMNDTVHEIDPTRKTSITSAATWGFDHNIMNNVADIVSLNYYKGWYEVYPNETTLKDELDKVYETYKGQNKIFGIGEYGAGSDTTQHDEVDDDFRWYGFGIDMATGQPIEGTPADGKYTSGGYWHPIEWQNYLHEMNYKAIEESPWLWATHIWNMFDFGSDGRSEGTEEMHGKNDKGMVTFDRSVKKDAFYFYKAQWNETDEFVHITSKDFTDRKSDTVQVKAYSNAEKFRDTVALFVDGKKIGAGTKTQTGVYVWNDVKIAEDGSTNIEVKVLNGFEAIPNGVSDSVTGWGAAGEVSVDNKTIPLSAEKESDANKEYAKWQFQKGEGASVETVSIPHCWNKEDGIDGGSNYWQGKAIYTKTVDVSEINNKNAFLQFDGANKITNVYIDGEHIGEHIGGYTAFAFDISKYIKDKDSIEIRAEVDNTSTAYNPTTGDFTQYGGIYRDVRIFTTNDIYISKEDYGSSGVSTLPVVTEGTIKDGGESGKIADATLKVNTKISFKNTNEQTVKVVSTLKDANGAVIATQTSDITGAIDGENVKIEDVAQDFGTLSNVNLWNGIQKGENKAYLYTLDIEVQDKNGNILDSQSQKIGFRKFDFKAVGTQEAEQSGFWLNDAPYLLRGVAVHQDFKGYGNAVYNDVRMKDFELMEEMGVNTIRAAHYPYDQFYYDVADEKGIVVWAENPNVNNVPTKQEYKDNGIEQLKEMIKQLYNHASIACWAIENQVNSGGGIGSTGSADSNIMDYLHLMNDTAHEMDPTRKTAITTAATWGFDSGIMDNVADIVSLNYYKGWYEVFPNKTTLKDELDKAYNTYKGQNKIFGIGEYGAGSDITQHDEINNDFRWYGFGFDMGTRLPIEGTPADGKYTSGGWWHPVEWQNYLHEMNYKAIEESPWLWATHIWNMFDFASDSRSEGTEEMHGKNDKGMVTFDRSVKKDVFYFYKAQWNEKEEFVHLTSKDFTDRTSDTVQVKAYSNAEKFGDTVVLVVDGIRVGYGNRTQTGVYVWDNVKIARDGSTNIEVQIVNGIEGLPTGHSDSTTGWKVTDSGVSGDGYLLSNEEVVSNGLGKTVKVNIDKNNAAELEAPKLLVEGTLTSGAKAYWSIDLTKEEKMTTDISVNSQIENIKVYLVDGAIDYDNEDFGGSKGNILTISTK